jgi:hypothetical protein
MCAKRPLPYDPWFPLFLGRNPREARVEALDDPTFFGGPKLQPLFTLFRMHHLLCVW